MFQVLDEFRSGRAPSGHRTQPSSFTPKESTSSFPAPGAGVDEASIHKFHHRYSGLSGSKVSNNTSTNNQRSAAVLSPRGPDERLRHPHQPEGGPRQAHSELNWVLRETDLVTTSPSCTVSSKSNRIQSDKSRRRRKPVPVYAVAPAQDIAPTAPPAVPHPTTTAGEATIKISNLEQHVRDAVAAIVDNSNHGGRNRLLAGMKGSGDLYLATNARGQNNQIAAAATSANSSQRNISHQELGGGGDRGNRADGGRGQMDYNGTGQQVDYNGAGHRVGINGAGPRMDYNGAGQQVGYKGASHQMDITIRARTLNNDGAAVVSGRGGGR